MISDQIHVFTVSRGNFEASNSDSNRPSHVHINMNIQIRANQTASFRALDEAEFSLYEQVYARMVVDPPKPDLVIYLQAPVDVLLERIGRRRIKAEQLIERPYLEKLNEAYARFFHDYDGAPTLIVNAAALDPLSSEVDFNELLGAIRRMGKGKLYFNPLRHAAI